MSSAGTFTLYDEDDWRGYFALGIVMNAVSRSRSERMVMTPTVVVLTATCLVLALSR